MATVRDLVNALRARGVTVHEWPGWDGRGNEGVPYIYPKGAVLHHTASAYGSAYAGLVSSTRPDLYGGMLANFAGNADGSLTVLGSGCAWHAGAGVGPSLGRVLGAIPNIRNRMNYETVGLEIVYPGDQPMTDAQYRTAVVFARVVADVCAGGDVEAVRGHAETNGANGDGKWDPGYAPGKTIDLAALRRAASNLQEDDLQADERAALFEVRARLRGSDPNFDMPQLTLWSVQAVQKLLKGSHTDSADRLSDLWAQGQAILTAVLKGDGVDVEALAKALAPLLSASITTVSDADLARIAKAVQDEQAKRLAD